MRPVRRGMRRREGCGTEGNEENEMRGCGGGPRRQKGALVTRQRVVLVSETTEENGGSQRASKGKVEERVGRHCEKPNVRSSLRSPGRLG